MIEPENTDHHNGSDLLDQQKSLSTSSFSLAHLSAYCRLSNGKGLELLQKAALKKVATFLACW